MQYPNYPGKWKEKDEIVTTKDYIKYIKKLGKYPAQKMPKNLVLCFNSKLRDKVLENFETEEIRLGSRHSIYVINGTDVGIVLVFGIGGAVTVTFVEELMALGVKNFIIIGDAGGLQKGMRIGDYILCNKALRDEGCSHHYLKPGRFAYPTKGLYEKLKSAIDRAVAYKEGPSWTIDIPYRETKAEARKYREEGILTVEMEAAAVFAVAEFRGAGAAAIFTISDILDEKKWDPWFHTTNDRLFGMFKIVLGALE